MHIRIFNTKELASAYVAALVDNLINQLAHPVVGLATGTDQEYFYRYLVSFYRNGQSFSHVTAIILNEYLGLSNAHTQSCFCFMKDHLFKFLDIPQSQIYMPDGLAENFDDECRRFDKILEDNPIDLQIVEIGNDGRMGLNVPNCSLTIGTHVIKLSSGTVSANTWLKSGGHVPPSAITIGIQPILRAKQIVLLAFGVDKAHAVRGSLSGRISTYIPASILQVHPNVTFALDKEAATTLSKSKKEYEH